MLPPLSVIQPFDHWSIAMSVVAPTLWGSGASRRRERLLDDTGGVQSHPADSEHGSSSFSRSRSTSFSTRWSVFSLREALFARSTRWSSPTRASSAFDSTLMEMMLLGAFGGASSSTTATHYFAVCVDLGTLVRRRSDIGAALWVPLVRTSAHWLGEGLT